MRKTVEAVRVLLEAMRMIIEAVRKIIEAVRLFVEARDCLDVVPLQEPDLHLDIANEHSHGPYEHSNGL